MQSATNCYTGGILIGYGMTFNHKKDGWKCPVCKEIFSVRRELENHKKTAHRGCRSHTCIVVKNNYICKFCGKQLYTTSYGLANHDLRCRLNPDRRVFNMDCCRTPEFRRLRSEQQKERHRLGLAKKFSTRDKVGHSYPERWLIEVLRNNFNQLEGVDYVTELPFYGYFLDFAWVTRRLCIEMDGNCHLMPERKASDAKKEALLLQNGWKLLRVKWGYAIKYKEDTVNRIKVFLTECGDVSFPLYKTAAERQMEEKKVNARLKEIYRAYFEQVWNERKERILSSGIDLHKFGWGREVSKKTGLTRKQINLTVKRFPELAGKVFIRPSPGTANKRETLGIYGANHTILESEFCRRRDMILASGVDLTKCGWQKTLIACTGMGKDMINRVIEHFPDIFANVRRVRRS